MAAILRIVIGGEGTRRGIANGANLSFSQVKQYLLLLLDTDLLRIYYELVGHPINIVLNDRLFLMLDPKTDCYQFVVICYTLSLWGGWQLP